MAEYVAVAGLVLSAYGMSRNMDARANARRAQEEAQTAQRAQASASNRRSRVQAIERARKRRAAAMAGAQAQGALQSSSVQGAMGAFQSDTGANMAFQRSLQQAESARFGALQQASESQGRARTFQAISKIPGQLGFDNAKTFQNLIDTEGQ